MILPFSVVYKADGMLIAQFLTRTDASMFSKDRVRDTVVIDTYRLADFRRNIKLAANTRNVEVLT